MIKILFIDTSALLSFFVSDKGTSTMRWLMSSDNKKHNATRYVINNQVISEFKNQLAELVRNDEIKESTADNILHLFTTHYRNQKFKVVGKDASVNETLDGMYNYLGRLSRPILVTSNQQNIINAQEYQTINHQTQTPDEIELAMSGRKWMPKESGPINLYKRIFNKTRISIHFQCKSGKYLQH